MIRFFLKLSLCLLISIVGHGQQIVNFQMRIFDQANSQPYVNKLIKGSKVAIVNSSNTILFSEMHGEKTTSSTGILILPVGGGTLLSFAD